MSAARLAAAEPGPASLAQMLRRCAAAWGREVILDSVEGLLPYDVAQLARDADSHAYGDDAAQLYAAFRGPDVRRDEDVDAAQLADLLEEGASLVLYQAEFHSRWASALLADVRRGLDGCIADASVNLVLSRQSRGFVPHDDPVDVLVLQLHGEKTWWMGKPPADDGTSCGAAPDEDLEPILLRPGAALYFPRGTRHCTETASTESLSASVFLVPRTAGQSLRADHRDTRVPLTRDWAHDWARHPFPR